MTPYPFIRKKDIFPFSIRAPSFIRFPIITYLSLEPEEDMAVYYCRYTLSAKTPSLAPLLVQTSKKSLLNVKRYFPLFFSGDIFNSVSYKNYFVTGTKLKDPSIVQMPTKTLSFVEQLQSLVLLT